MVHDWANAYGKKDPGCLAYRPQSFLKQKKRKNDFTSYQFLLFGGRTNEGSSHFFTFNLGPEVKDLTGQTD